MNPLIQVSTDQRFAPRPNTVVVLAAPAAPRPASVPVTSACAVIRDAGGRILLCHHRPAGGSTRGYDLPGGHLEAGETAELACRREIVEETGLRLAATTTLTLAATIVIDVAGPPPPGYRYPYPLTQMWVYSARVADEKPPVGPPPGSECDSAVWLAPDEVAAATGPRIWLPVVPLA